MLTLEADDITALHGAFEHGGPVGAKEIVTLTGLDIRQLKEAGIVRQVGRWDAMLYKGVNWPAKPPEIEREFSVDDELEQAADRMGDYKFERDRDRGKELL